MLKKFFGKNKSRSAKLIDQNGVSQPIAVSTMAASVAAKKSSTLDCRDAKKPSASSINSSDVSNSSTSTNHSSLTKSPEESFEIKEKLEGQINLKITIKHLNVCTKLPVDRAKPLLDILVMVAAEYSFNPADYIINVDSETKQFIRSNSNPVGLLGVDQVTISPKSINTKTRPSTLPWTRRFRIYLPKRQQFVHRIPMNMKFHELKSKVCDEKSLNPSDYILVKHFIEGQKPEVINLDKTPNDYSYHYKDLQLLSLKNFEQISKQFTSDSPFNHTLSLDHSGFNRLSEQTNDWSQSTPNISMKQRQSDTCSLASNRNSRGYKKKPAPPPPRLSTIKLNGTGSVQNLNVIPDENEDNISNITEPSTPTAKKNWKNDSVYTNGSIKTSIRSRPISTNNNCTTRTRLSRQNSGSDSSGYYDTLSNTPTESNSPEPNVSPNPPSEIDNGKQENIVVGVQHERKLVQEKPIPKTRHSKLTSSLSPRPKSTSFASVHSKKRRAPLPPTVRSISLSDDHRSQSPKTEQTNNLEASNSPDSYNDDPRVGSPCTVTSEELPSHSLGSEISYATTTSSSLLSSAGAVMDLNCDSKLDVQPTDGASEADFEKQVESKPSPEPPSTQIDHQDNNESGGHEVEPKNKIIADPKQQEPPVVVENVPINDQSKSITDCGVGDDDHHPPTIPETMDSSAIEIIQVEQKKDVDIVPNNRVELKCDVDEVDNEHQRQIVEKEDHQNDLSDNKAADVVVALVSSVPEKSEPNQHNSDEGNVGNIKLVKKDSFFKRFSTDLDQDSIKNDDDDEFHERFRKLVEKFNKNRIRPTSSSSSSSSFNQLSGDKVKPSAAATAKELNNNTKTVVVAVDVHHAPEDHVVPEDNKIQDLTSETIQQPQQQLKQQHEEQLQPQEIVTNLNPIDHHQQNPVEDKKLVSPTVTELCEVDLVENKKGKEEEAADEANLDEKMNGKNSIVVITDWKRRSSSTLADNNNNNDNNNVVADAAVSTSPLSMFNGGGVGDHEQLGKISKEKLEKRTFEKQMENALNELNETLNQQSDPTLPRTVFVGLNQQQQQQQQQKQQHRPQRLDSQENPSFIDRENNNINHCNGDDVSRRNDRQPPPHHQSISSLRTSTSSASGRTKIMINSMGDNNNKFNSLTSSSSFSVHEKIRKFNTVNEKNVSQQDLSSLRNVNGYAGNGNLGTIPSSNILRRSSSKLSNHGDEELFASKVTRKLTNFQIGSFKNESSVDIYGRSTKPPISTTRIMANINPQIINNNSNTNSNHCLNNGRPPPPPSPSSSKTKTSGTTVVSFNPSNTSNSGGFKPKYAKSMSMDVMENNHNHNHHHNWHKNNNFNDNIKIGFKQDQLQTNANQVNHVNNVIMNAKRNDKSTTAATITATLINNHNQNGYNNGFNGMDNNNKSQPIVLPNFLQELKTKSQQTWRHRNGEESPTNMDMNDDKQNVVTGGNDKTKPAALINQHRPSPQNSSSKQTILNGSADQDCLSNDRVVDKQDGVKVEAENGVGDLQSSPAPPPPPPPPPPTLFSSGDSSPTATSVQSSSVNRLSLSPNLMAPKGWHQNESKPQIRSPLKSSVSMETKQQNGNDRNALLNDIKKFHSHSKLKKVATNQPYCLKYN